MSMSSYLNAHLRHGYVAVDSTENKEAVDVNSDALRSMIARHHRPNCIRSNGDESNPILLDGIAPPPNVHAPQCPCPPPMSMPPPIFMPPPGFALLCFADSLGLVTLLNRI